MNRCPIYNSVGACDMHSDCLFLRNGGCAIVLAATLADENSKEIKRLSSKLDSLEYNLSLILRKLGE
jgi:hypothetical protein